MVDTIHPLLQKILEGQGASPSNPLPPSKAGAVLRQFREQVADWRADCQKCHRTLVGTLQQIREHKCDPGS